MPPSTPLDVSDWLGQLSSSVAREFEANRQLLSFDEYLDLVVAQPARFARNSAQYLLDAIRSFGTTPATEPGALPRHNLFDAPYAGGEDKVIGNERLQAELIRLLENFVSERRINKLVLLHGPNGSAKSSFVGCLIRAIEAYSATPDGALYRFNWVFPSRNIEGGRIGFGSAPTGKGSDSYAHLPEDRIDVKIGAEHQDNPLFLIPRPQRETLLQQALAAAGDAGFVLSDAIREGDLGHRSRQIFDALFASCRGDLGAVYRHVQVERFSISRRYRRGAVTVEPQLRVDASVRQITSDRSLGALPPALQTQTLFEVYGPLAEGNRGIVEFNDLLKRPMDLNRYLLATSEKGIVSLDTGDIHLDTLLLATSNETYLDAFKGQPDWPSYKGRIELLRMPYLLDFRAEQQIYDELLAATPPRKPVAPHLTFVAALWAVLTRLCRPRGEGHPRPIQSLVSELSPLAKARLYAGGELPSGLQADQRQQLLLAVPRMLTEGAEGQHYEGRYGASPREMKTLLLNVLHGHTTTASPLQLLAEIKAMIRDTSVYEWLRIEADGEYQRPDRFVTEVREVYLDRVERELRSATGLVDEAEHGRLFDKYVTHSNHWLRNERLTDPATGQQMPADLRMMEEVEKILGRDESERDFRSHLMSKVGAFKIDHPDDPVDLVRVFPHFVDRLRDHYYQSRRRAVERTLQAMLGQLDAAEPAADATERASADAALTTLCDRFGYHRASIGEPLSVLLRERYAVERRA